MIQTNINGNKKAALESCFDVIGRNCLDGRGTDREIIQYPTISVNIQLNTSTAQRDSVMSSCGCSIVKSKAIGKARSLFTPTEPNWIDEPAVINHGDIQYFSGTEPLSGVFTSPLIN